MAFGVLCIAVLAALSTAAAVLVGERAADGNGLAADDGWIVLFDGKTLDGWEPTESPKNWTVEDGCICGTGSRSHLFYIKREFQNFEFKADVMINKGGNSGIYFHSKPEADWPKQGYESQVNNTHGDPVKTGSLYNTVKVFKSAAKDDTWWTQTIIVKGKQITVKVNDETIFEYDEPEGVTGPRKLSKGYFAFQAHDPGSKVRFRNVKVKPAP
ncbi:MAG TPA: DUF1080 domain-containing protein [Pirellulales bacterium]|nr:DUF1080 domain-containing protein [Pirellulales bacterium]